MYFGNDPAMPQVVREVTTVFELSFYIVIVTTLLVLSSMWFAKIHEGFMKALIKSAPAGKKTA